MNKRILILDDEKDLTNDIFSKIRKDFQITRTSSPVEAIEIIKISQTFAVILADLRLHEINGLEFLREASKLSPMSVPLIMCESADKQLAMEASNKGKAFKFLVKPFKANILHSVLSDSVYQHYLIQSEYESTKLKEEFLSIVSEAYRDPLEEVKALSEKLNAELDKLPDNKTLKEYSQKIIDSNSCMIELMNKMILLKDLDNKDNYSNPKEIDLLSSVRKICGDFLIRNKKKFEIDILVDDSEKDFYTDESILKIIFDNLLQNSVKYSDDPLIIIELMRKKNFFEISFTDNGAGINTKDIPHIFDAFYCGNNKKHKGSGLGLAIVKKALDLNDSYIEIDQSYKDGTKFIIKLNPGF